MGIGSDRRLAAVLVLVFAAAGFRFSINAMPQSAGVARAERPVRLSKPRIEPKLPSRWTAEDKELAARFSDDGGLMNDFRTLLNHPELVRGIMPFTNYISGGESTLPPEKREMLIMRVAWVTQSDYLWSHHNSAVPAQGPFEAAHIRAVDEMILNGTINASTWEALAGQYGPLQMMDLAFTIGQFTMWAGMINSVGVQPEVVTPGVELQRLPNVPYQINVPPRDPPLRAARVKALEPSEWSPAAKALVDPGNTGRAIGLYRTFVNNTKLYPLRHLQSEHIRLRATLSQRQRELLILRTAWLARGEYPWAQHVRQGRSAGLDTAKIPLGAAAPGWEPMDKALIQAADDLYYRDMVSDTTWNTLVKLGLNNQQLMDVLVTAGGYRIVAIVGSALGVQLEPNAERFPAK